MSTDDLAVVGRSRLPSGIAPIARRLMRRMAVRGSNVSIGPGFRVGPGAIISAPHKLEIGSWVNIGPRSIVQVDGEIGDFCLIGMHVQIVGRDDHALHEVGVPVSLATWVGDRAQRDRDRVVIGRDVWIGGGSIILSGVEIGNGAVVAAGSVVTRSVAAFEIVAGNPAKRVSERFQSTIERDQHLRLLDELTRNFS